MRPREAMIATYESRLKLQQAMIDQAAASVKSAEADLSRAQQDYKRYSALMTSDFASRQRFEQAEADARKAEAALAKSRAAFAAEQNQLAVLQSQQREEEARLQQARANLRLAQERSRQYGDPRADFRSGRQSRRPGRPVRQARDPAAVAGAVAARLRHREFQGDAADPDAAGAARRGVGRRLSRIMPLEGRIESFAPASGAQFSLLPPDNATGNFTKIVQRVPVRIALPASGPLAGLLRPGLSVTVTVDTRDAGDGDGLVGAAQAEIPMSAPRDDLVASHRRCGGPRRRPRSVRSGSEAGGARRQPAQPRQPAQSPPRLRDWLGVLAMVVGLFMAIMDVQIVTSSLTQIQGGLSASTDEISWVQTSYLIADVVMVPLSGTLSRLLSTRVLFVIAALGFTGASALCATATSLGQMIVYRAMQGFSGGAMMPLVFPVVYTKFRGPQLATDHGADLG